MWYGSIVGACVNFCKENIAGAYELLTGHSGLDPTTRIDSRHAAAVTTASTVQVAVNGPAHGRIRAAFVRLRSSADRIRVAHRLAERCTFRRIGRKIGAVIRRRIVEGDRRRAA